MNAYSQLDRRAEALDLMQEILESQSQMPPSRRSGGLLYDLLHDFCEEQDVPSAEKCVNLLKQTDAFPPKGRLCLSYAKYCKLMGRMDSCIYYCRMALVPDDSIGMYEALRRLFYIYDSQDNKALTLEYAREFMDLSTDMDWGRRQELAATVNKQPIQVLQEQGGGGSSAKRKGQLARVSVDSVDAFPAYDGGCVYTASGAKGKAPEIPAWS